MALPTAPARSSALAENHDQPAPNTLEEPMNQSLSPHARLQYDELVYVLRSMLDDGDADAAVETLDALLEHHRDQVVEHARTRVAELPTANDGNLITSTREAILAAITA
ncbi:hypothetical protein ACFWXO_05455 [Kitasatospora sp. NPDC059088]|uniref:hypothetical protein n=1 Tax=Kitasatospora sp. NPDC059088 TaxID=3346722 RepID=UPI003694996D